jgi:hypothetical protein
LRLAEQYGPDRLEAACRRAIAFGNLEYSGLENILENGLYKAPLEPVTLPIIKSEKGAYLRDPREFNAKMEVSR